MATALTSLVTVVTALAHGDVRSPAPVDIGSAKQLLVDDALLESVRGATFEMHPPQVHELGAAPLLLPDSSWETDDEMRMGLYCSVLTKADGTFQPSVTHFTSLADPSAIGSGYTGLTTLMHEAGHAAHFSNIEMPSPLFSQERSPTSGK